jgi:hypothetical protein
MSNRILYKGQVSVALYYVSLFDIFSFSRRSAYMRPSGLLPYASENLYDVVIAR